MPKAIVGMLWSNNDKISSVEKRGRYPELGLMVKRVDRADSGNNLGWFFCQLHGKKHNLCWSGQGFIVGIRGHHTDVH